MNMLLKSSANRKRIRLFHIWTRFNIFWFRFVCAWLWLEEKFLQKWRWFFVVTTRVNNETTKQRNCRFLLLKRNIQNVTAGIALFTVVETSRFIGWNVNTLWTCWTVHISDSLYVVHTHNYFFPILVDWNGTLSRTCLSGTIFFGKEKSCFVCFCRLYVLL